MALLLGSAVSPAARFQALREDEQCGQEPRGGHPNEEGTRGREESVFGNQRKQTCAGQGTREAELTDGGWNSPEFAFTTFEELVKGWLFLSHQ